LKILLLQFQNKSFVISKFVFQLQAIKVIIKRIYKSVWEYKEKYPIPAVTGPRQSCKTTLLKAFLPNYRYLSLENPDAQYFVFNDPNGFLIEYNDEEISDELQQAPALFSYIQTLVDSRANKMVGFILSGSQNFHLICRITQSLEG